jgi:1-acyl-sn-glycerol-3-phosphate acyltransferase
MGFRLAVVNFILKRIISSLCRIDCQEYFDALAKYKPMIIVFNHINFLEIPMLAVFGYPHLVTGMAKSESWDNTIFSFLFNTYKAIPINREGAFTEVFRQVRKTIDSGFYVMVAPEGTRSKNGVLNKGKAGILYLAHDTDTPILPVVHYGGEKIWDNMLHFKRTGVTIRAGRPFRIKFDSRPARGVRDEVLDEVMGQMARLLPPEMRGIYAESAEHECKHLDFL